MRRKNPKRTVPTLNYSVNSFSDYQTISNMQDTRKLVFNNLIEAIEDSMRSKKNEASIFMIDYDHYVSLNKKSWKKSLKTAIEFFSSEGIEEYEICKKCVDLIHKIESDEKITVEDE
jgi:homoaconitase/3-isopropylmalate dehydratase large subunit